MKKLVNGIINAHDNQEGSVGILLAALLPLLLGVAALAVDLAAAHLQKRTAQSIADLAAISAAERLGSAEAVARATLNANKVPFNNLSVTLGYYKASTAVAPALRFEPGQLPANSVRVSFSRPTNLYFARLFINTPPQISVTAIGQSPKRASFSIGSRLAALRGGVANQLLDGLLGIDIGLSVMDYEALVDTRVRIDDLLGAISEEVSLQAGTYSEVLDATVSLSDISRSAALAARNDGNSPASHILSAITGAASREKLVPLRALVDVGPYGGDLVGTQTNGLKATLSVLDILRSSAMIANGEHQVVTSTALDIPGLGSVVLKLAIGEHSKQTPWVQVGETGSKVTTSQLKLLLDVRADGRAPLSVIHLPIYVEAAYATAELSSVTCSAPSRSGATVSVLPGVARVAIADVTDGMLRESTIGGHLPKATLVNTALLKVKGSAALAITNLAPVELSFDEQDIADNAVRTVSTNDLLGSIVSLLVKDLELGSTLLGSASRSCRPPKCEPYWRRSQPRSTRDIGGDFKDARHQRR